MYNYKGLTINWETKAFNRSFEGKDLPFNGLNFRVIDNYGSVLDEFSGAYGIDIKPDNESINSFIRRHIDQNEEKYIKILQENGFDSEGLVKTIYELEESEKYRFGYHFLAPLDKDGYLLYDTAKEFTQIVPEEYYQTADNEKLFKWLSNFDRIKYAEAVEFGNVKYEKDVVTELSVDYGSDAYKLYESDLYSDTIDKMLMSEMSLEDLLQIQQNIINYRCGMFACTPLHPKEETTYIVQDDIEKAEAYRQSNIYKELPESRARQILSGALDYLSELLKGQELYNVLSGSVGMTHEELESEGFTLQNYYEEETEDEEIEM